MFFRHQQGDFELEMSRILRTDRDVSFSFTNNMDRALLYMYWFASDDGEVMRPGAGDVDPGASYWRMQLSCQL
ncbi:MAG: hypothetical protein AAFO91_15505 [Bacteroidota bacterium]